jgi:hypothetical protein
LVDTTDLTLFATLVQTVVITATLIVFIFQFRSQEKAIHEASYQSVMGRYNDYVLSGTESENALIARLISPANPIAPEEMSRIRRIMIAYGIIEEAYELYKKGWIDKETWDQWDAWLKVMSRHPMFGMLHTASTGMFDRDFHDHVSQMIVENSTSPSSPQPEK